MKQGLQNISTHYKYTKIHNGIQNLKRSVYSEHTRYYMINSVIQVMQEWFMRILVAEDYKDLADTYKTALEARGHIVITTRDGMECIQTYKEFTKYGNNKVRVDKSYFDVVILDHFMPGMDGVDVIKEIQSINPKQRIIFITGGGNTILRKLREIKENVEFMNKPFTLQAFITQIESWPLHMWRVRCRQGFKEWDGYEGTSIAVGQSRS